MRFKKYLKEYSGGSIVPQTIYGAYGNELRRNAKTGVSYDYIKKGSRNTSGIAAHIAVYDDPLDPRKSKERKKSWFTGKGREI